MTYSQRIRAHRKSLGLTEEKYAAQLGVRRGTIQQWESGKTAPKRDRQAAVAMFMGVTVSELMSENDGIEPGPAMGGGFPFCQTFKLEILWSMWTTSTLVTAA